MKRFCKVSAFFSIPILVFVFVLEWYLRTSEGEYLLKSKHFKAANYEVLILGSSHTQNAINPALLSVETCSGAMGGQDLKINLSLLKKSIETNPNLKVVVLEISYHIFRENPPNYWRNSLYEYFFDLKLNEDVNFSKYFLLVSNLKFFRNFFGAKLSQRKHKYQYNKFGFDENDFDGIFKDIEYNENEADRLAERFRKNATNENWPPPKSLEYLREINSLCVDNDLKLVLIATPLYRTWLELADASKKEKREKIIMELRKTDPTLRWINFETSDAFKITHFKNENHLNATGATMFTKMLNDTLVATSDRHVSVIPPACSLENEEN